MNLLTALCLSSQRQASITVYDHLSASIKKEAYRVKVSEQVYDISKGDILLFNPYSFEVFRVTYPDKADGKGWGEPHVAENAHHSRNFKEGELIVFCEKIGFTDWTPVENDNA